MTNKKIENPATPDRSLPKTGDTSNISFALIGLAVSATVIGVLYFRRKKAKAE